MTRFLFLVALTCIIALNFSCKKTLTGSEQDIPGRRDYVWTVDTLDMQINWISSIWGSSPDNVWVTADGGEYNERLFHYDGSKWSKYTKEIIDGGGIALYGFNENDVWMGGGGGWTKGATIWHYNGSKWIRNYIYNVEGAASVEVYDVWGQSLNDVYACGVIGILVNGDSEFRGFVLHYDGNSWKEVYKADFNSQFLRIRKEQNNLYVFSYVPNQINGYNDSIVFYKMEGDQLNKIYSNTRDAIHWGSISLIKDNLYFTIDKDIFLYRESIFVKQFSVDNSNFWFDIFGRNAKDIFLPMGDGIAHFDGMTIDYIYKLINGLTLSGQPMFFEKDVFFALFDGAHSKYMVLHGTLKE